MMAMLAYEDTACGWLLLMHWCYGELQIVEAKKIINSSEHYQIALYNNFGG